MIIRFAVYFIFLLSNSSPLSIFDSSSAIFLSFSIYTPRNLYTINATDAITAPEIRNSINFCISNPIVYQLLCFGNTLQILLFKIIFQIHYWESILSLFRKTCPNFLDFFTKQPFSDYLLCHDFYHPSITGINITIFIKIF